MLSLLPRKRSFSRKGKEEFNHLELDKIHLLQLTLKSSFGGFKALNQVILKHNICLFLALSVNEVVEKEHFGIFKKYILEYSSSIGQFGAGLPHSSCFP